MQLHTLKRTYYNNKIFVLFWERKGIIAELKLVTELNVLCRIHTYVFICPLLFLFRTHSCFVTATLSDTSHVTRCR
jgi:hypothetical protein